MPASWAGEPSTAFIAGAQNDTGGGGCFAAYKPSTTQVITKVNPIEALQMVRGARWWPGTR
ncbi:hypothetical protein ACFRJ9_03385 [Paenarthrobacter sp. NPDC056912]|uniref:hypothetical protein n=1 Tax=Paenarthrobacter sp. NPDC056912 TaxID=3345965 RepID=UPI00366B9F8B